MLSKEQTPDYTGRYIIHALSGRGGSTRSLHKKQWQVVRSKTPLSYVPILKRGNKGDLRKMRIKKKISFVISAILL